MTSLFKKIQRSPSFPITSLLLGLMPFLVWVIYLLAFWPGIMSFDSFSQWDQAMRFSFSDWHPVFSTLTIWAAIRIWTHPASVIIFQIIFYSIVISFTLVSFLRIGVPKWLLLFISFSFAVFLPNGLMAITMWKDIPYSVCILGATAVLLKIIISQGEWLQHKSNWFILSGFCIGLSLLRHNGIPIAIGTFFAIMIFYRKYWKSIISSFIIFIACYFIITGPIYNLLPINQEQGQSIGVTFIHPVAAHVNAGDTIPADDLNFLNQIRPLSKGWDYSCYDATVLFYRGVNFSPVQQDPMRIIKIFWDLTISNPTVTINHFLCLSSFVWRIDQPEGVYLETVLLNSYNDTTQPLFGKYVSIANTNSKLEVIHDLVQNIYGFMNSDPEKIVWRPAIYLYLLLISIILVCFLIRDFHYLLLLVPVIIHSTIIMFVAQLEALRYQYPVYIITLLFAFPLLWYAITAKRKMTSESSK
jgi:hypothetical protein